MKNLINVDEWFQFFGQLFSQTGTQIASFLPHLIAAVIIFIIGWILARMLRKASHHLFQVIGIDRLAEKTEITNFFHRANLDASLSKVLSQIVYWVLFLVVIIAALETLQLNEVSQALAEFINFIPNLFAALLILLLGTLLAKVCGDIVQAATASAEIKYGGSIARVAYAFVMVFMIIIALDKLGIDTSIFTTNINLIIGGIVGIAVLAVGMGGRAIAGNILAHNYLKGLIEVGDVFEVENVTGTVRKITATTVVLETKHGKVLVPNNQFMVRVVGK